MSDSDSYPVPYSLLIQAQIAVTKAHYLLAEMLEVTYSDKEIYAPLWESTKSLGALGQALEDLRVRRIGDS